MNIFEILRKRALLYPDRTVWEDDERTYSFSEIENASGKIYRYLKNTGIGKEDIVAIRLPRSGRIFTVMLGVWKAGAAFVTFGEHSPEEYVSFQMEETKPKMVFGLTDFESAMGGDFLDSYEKTDEHDLAFIVYSTGSTGLFKGSMHEYGAIQKAICRTAEYWDENENPLMGPTDYRALFDAGFYTMTAVIYLLDVIISNYYLYILPGDMIGNLMETGRILTDRKITNYIATTRDFEYIKSLHSPYLKDLSISREINSASFNSEYASFNTYGMSESLCILSCFQIDRHYDIVPIGKGSKYIPMKIVDKDGNPTGNGEIGEICFIPEYWRGYVNRPEKTRAAYYDGWFHTGDMAYVNGDGNMVVVGRKTDIAETENGYIVPAFIETAFRKVFPDAEKCHVRIFKGKSSPTVCLYYCGKTEYPEENMRQALGISLPEYCIPDYYIKMDEFTYLPGGKLNRNTFLNPEDYTAGSDKGRD